MSYRMKPSKNAAPIASFMLGHRDARVWSCSSCPMVDHWGPGWMWYGSLRDQEQGYIEAVLCPSCAERIGAQPID